MTATSTLKEALDHRPRHPSGLLFLPTVFLLSVFPGIKTSDNFRFLHSNIWTRTSVNSPPNIFNYRLSLCWAAARRLPSIPTLIPTHQCLLVVFGLRLNDRPSLWCVCEPSSQRLPDTKHLLHNPSEPLNASWWEGGTPLSDVPDMQAS